MNILGIETSCDETAAAVVANGTNLLSSVLSSQVKIHAPFGGVVPEVAARSHIGVMLPIITQALTEAKLGWDEIDAIAVTQGPGLIGSLLIGTVTASTLATLKHKPLIPVNHVEAHAYANFLMEPRPKFPMLALIVSGGHTQLVLFRDHGDYDVLGKTLDDAAGEAFDKVARMIGLPQASGAAIATAAEHGDARAFAFPKPRLHNSLDFSFSGPKTAVLRSAQAAVGRDFRTPSFELAKLLNDQQRADISASFQKTTVDTLVDRVLQAYASHSPISVVIGGGVAANKTLRSELERRLPIKITYAPIQFCTDNAAMIASLGYFRAHSGQNVDYVSPNPVLSM